MIDWVWNIVNWIWKNFWRLFKNGNKKKLGERTKEDVGDVEVDDEIEEEEEEEVVVLFDDLSLLPLECFERIVGFLDSSSLLALGKTSHFLRDRLNFCLVDLCGDLAKASFCVVFCNAKRFVSIEDVRLTSIRGLKMVKRVELYDCENMR